MTIQQTKTALELAERAPHEHNCDLSKIGSPGRPYRNCTCGVDKTIAALKKHLRSLSKPRTRRSTGCPPPEAYL